MSLIRRNNRLLLTLVAAWSILLGASQALHAVYHLTLPGTVSSAGDHSCALCLLDRNPLLATPETVTAIQVPEPQLLPLPAPSVAVGTSPAFSYDSLSPSAGRAPPVSAAS